MLSWVKFLYITCFIFVFSSCSRTLLPPSLAVVGGGIGALTGNPLVAAGGAGAGAAAGQLLLMDKDKVESEVRVLKALTSGDVNELVNAKLDDAKNNGFFDNVLAEVYGVLKLCVIGLALWFIVPMLYSHWRAKKTEEKWKTD